MVYGDFQTLVVIRREAKENGAKRNLKDYVTTNK